MYGSSSSVNATPLADADTQRDNHPTRDYHNTSIEVRRAVVPTRRRNMSHTARETIDLLKETFGDRLISRFGPVNWPPRSCDLTPLDYFLWGYVKSLVYAGKPQTLDHLEDNIHRVVAYIRPQMLEKSSKIGRPDWTTSEPTVAVLCQKSYLKM
ncbi:transposable element Tc3 transposase [Trichonephila clavipes]|nr:transposable element Tc3 transposase [Trichonephila clavipes]